MMRAVEKKIRNIPKEVSVSYRMILSTEHRVKIEEIVIDLLVVKIKELSQKEN